MSEIRFEDQSDEFGRPRERPAGFDMAGKLIAWGVASDRQQATYILLGIAVGAVVLGVFVFWFSSSGGGTTPVTRAQMDATMRAGSQNVQPSENGALGI